MDRRTFVKSLVLTTSGIALAPALLSAEPIEWIDMTPDYVRIHALNVVKACKDGGLPMHLAHRRVFQHPEHGPTYTRVYAYPLVVAAEEKRIPLFMLMDALRPILHRRGMTYINDLWIAPALGLSTRQVFLVGYENQRLAYAL